MRSKKNNWGLFSFSVAIGLCGALFYFRNDYSSLFATAEAQRLLNFSGIVLSVLLCWIGFFSYSRIQSLRIYLLSIVTGVCCGSGFALSAFPELFSAAEKASLNSFVVLYTHVCAYAVVFVPAQISYSTTKKITAVVGLVYALSLILLHLLDLDTAWLGFISARSEILLVSGGGIIILAAVFIRQQFFLGGLLSGFVLFSLLVPLFSLSGLSALLPVSAGLVPGMLYLIPGIGWHIFSTIEHRVLYDPLLNIFNREYCQKVLSGQSSLNLSLPFSLAMVDIDHFKKFNDTHGHHIGDLVLQSVAQTVANTAESAGGVCCRYGGEELAVFFPQTPLKEAEKAMEKVRKNVEKNKISHGSKKLSVHVSSGICCLDVGGVSASARTLEILQQTADKALYKAKKNGRNQVCAMKYRKT